MIISALVKMRLAYFVNALAVVSVVTSAAIQLPSAFLDRTIGSNSYDEISSAIALLELDDFLEVVLVGNFTQVDVNALAAVLEDSSLYSTVRPLRAHVYEKKIFRVSVASRVLTEKISKAVKDNSPSVVSNTFVNYHSQLGVSTTLFLVGIDERQDWSVPPSARDCVSVLNIRAPGAAWMYLDLMSFDREFSALTMGQYFDGFSNANAYELATRVEEVSKLLMPFPSSAISPPSATKDFIFLEISICDAYTRGAGASCPTDSLVLDTLRSLDKWQQQNNHVTVNVQSVSFNLHDHPELIYALHSASDYTSHSQSSSALDLELLLYYISKCKAVRRSISGATDAGGRNRDHNSYMLIPVFNIQLNGRLGFYTRRNRNIRSFVLPRWHENDPSMDYPALVGSELTAIVRLKSHQKEWEDLFSDGESFPCGDRKQSGWLWNGNVLFDMLVDIAFGVKVPAIGQMVEVSIDASSEESIMMPMNNLTNDFRRGRSVDRTLIISKLEMALSELHSILGAYAVLPSFGIQLLDQGLGKNELSIDIKYYESLIELINKDVEDIRIIDLFFNILSLADKVAVEFSHLNYDDVKQHLHDLELLLAKLREVYEYTARRTVPQKIVRFNWNNSLDEIDFVDVENIDEAGAKYPFSWRSMILGSFAGFFTFFLTKICGILFFDSRQNESKTNPFKRHASRGVMRT